MAPGVGAGDGVGSGDGSGVGGVGIGVGLGLGLGLGIGLGIGPQAHCTPASQTAFMTVSRSRVHGSCPPMINVGKPLTFALLAS